MEVQPSLSCAETGQTPIWFAALLAWQCGAVERAERSRISWRCCAGRALYTNLGPGAEQIHPFGISLERGETLAVWWPPGETTYLLEVYDGVATES